MRHFPAKVIQLSFWKPKFHFSAISQSLDLAIPQNEEETGWETHLTMIENDYGHQDAKPKLSKSKIVDSKNKTGNRKEKKTKPVGQKRENEKGAEVQEGDSVEHSGGDSRVSVKSNKRVDRSVSNRIGIMNFSSKKQFVIKNMNQEAFMALNTMTQPELVHRLVSYLELSNTRLNPILFHTKIQFFQRLIVSHNFKDNLPKIKSAEKSLKSSLASGPYSKCLTDELGKLIELIDFTKFPSEQEVNEMIRQHYVLMGSGEAAKEDEEVALENFVGQFLVGAKEGFTEEGQTAPNDSSLPKESDHPSTTDHSLHPISPASDQRPPPASTAPFQISSALKFHKKEMQICNSFTRVSKIVFENPPNDASTCWLHLSPFPFDFDEHALGESIRRAFKQFGEISEFKFLKFKDVKSVSLPASIEVSRFVSSDFNSFMQQNFKKASLEKGFDLKWSNVPSKVKKANQSMFEEIWNQKVLRLKKSVVLVRMKDVTAKQQLMHPDFTVFGVNFEGNLMHVLDADRKRTVFVLNSPPSMTTSEFLQMMNSEFEKNGLEKFPIGQNDAMRTLKGVTVYFTFSNFENCLKGMDVINKMQGQMTQMTAALSQNEMIFSKDKLDQVRSDLNRHSAQVLIQQKRKSEIEAETLENMKKESVTQVEEKKDRSGSSEERKNNFSRFVSYF